MIPIKTPQEIEMMARSGKILAEVMQKVLAKAVVGATTAELDKFADELILNAGARPSFKTEKGYGFATCMCVNDMVVHGIPGEYKLQDRDRLGIDCGVYFNGWHADASWSKKIASSQTPRNDIDVFLETGERALEAAIAQCQAGKHIGDISKAMEDVIRAGGYSPIKALVGHGIGKDLHEDPEISCYSRGRIENTPEIKIGMTLAIEVIYNMGKSSVVYANDDGWTIVTRDGLCSGLFEHTVAITGNGPRILTKF